MDEEVTRIRIGGNLVGISGLDAALKETAEKFGDRSDDEVRKVLFERLASRNYIPPRAADAYNRAFWDAFRIYRGECTEVGAVDGIRVAVLGPGCAQCSQLEIDVREVMAEMHLAGELLHIADFREIARYGVMGMPALVINEKVYASGTVPHRTEIRAWLSAVLANQGKS